MTRVAAVVLAAGMGTRFGGNKLLAPVNGRALLQVVLDAVLPAVDETVVVLGHDAEPVRALVRDLSVRTVINPRYAEGLGSSVAAGVSALSADVAAAAIVLGDQPLPAHVLPALIAARRQQAAPIIAPLYAGVRGNPVLFDRQLFPLLQELRGDRGARELIEQRADLLVTVPFDLVPPMDIDTRDDYTVMLRQD